MKDYLTPDERRWLKSMDAKTFDPSADCLILRTLQLLKRADDALMKIYRAGANRTRACDFSDEVNAILRGYHDRAHHEPRETKETSR